MLVKLQNNFRKHSYLSMLFTFSEIALAQES